ncbi:hypothetical protein DN069_33190, partial [Streptacidiphilus pinicola]
RMIAVDGSTRATSPTTALTSEGPAVLDRHHQPQQPGTPHRPQSLLVGPPTPRGTHGSLPQHVEQAGIEHRLRLCSGHF